MKTIKKKYVYVTYDPLLEKVVCVHDKSNTFCNTCDKLNKKRMKSSGAGSLYFLQESKRLIKTNDK